MPRGRPPKPIEQHRREGTLRKDRHRVAPVVVGGRRKPVRPRWLSGTARTAWDHMVDDLFTAGMIDRVDLGLLAAASQMWGRAVDAGRDVDKRGLMVEVVKIGRDGGEWTEVVENSAVRLERASWAQFMALADRLAIGPVARARLGANVDVGKSRLAEQRDRVGAPVPKLRAVK